MMCLNSGNNLLHKSQGYGIMDLTPEHLSNQRVAYSSKQCQKTNDIRYFVAESNWEESVA